LVRGEQATVEIGDEYTLTAPAQELMLSLMTPCTPEFREGGIILLEKAAGGCLQLQFDAARFAITAEKIEITDANLAPVWGDHLYRLVFRAMAPTEGDSWSMTIAQPASVPVHG
jgi:hypothetical protein